MLSNVRRSAELGVGASLAGETAGIDIFLCSLVLGVEAPLAKSRKLL